MKIAAQFQTGKTVLSSNFGSDRIEIMLSSLENDHGAEPGTDIKDADVHALHSDINGQLGIVLDRKVAETLAGLLHETLAAQDENKKIEQEKIEKAAEEAAIEHRRQVMNEAFDKFIKPIIQHAPQVKEATEQDLRDIAALKDSQIQIRLLDDDKLLIECVLGTFLVNHFTADCLHRQLMGQ